MRDDELSSEMEVGAAELALARAGVAKENIDAYYGYSTVPDEVEPQNHCLVHHMLGLREDSFAATLASGCATYLPRIMTASRMAQVGEHKHSVICVSGAMVKCTDYGYPGSVNVGDAAVASVVGKVDPGHVYIGPIQRSRGDLHRGIVMLPEGKPNVPSWHSDIHKGHFYATNDDQEATHIMGARSATLCKEACHEVLDTHGYTLEYVEFICLPHSASWFGQALAEAVGLGEPSKWVAYEDHYKK
jgi:3-oxoacyl-[acyl-carrier-protein] synthase III